MLRKQKLEIISFYNIYSLVFDNDKNIGHRISIISFCSKDKIFWIS